MTVKIGHREHGTQEEFYKGLSTQFNVVRIYFYAQGFKLTYKNGRTFMFYYHTYVLNEIIEEQEKKSR